MATLIHVTMLHAATEMSVRSGLRGEKVEGVNHLSYCIIKLRIHQLVTIFALSIHERGIKRAI
jgi:hypothetical protein